jgi:EAL domain-containing protein (putative c-di-GMP-specific phosphodiesterase class I)
VETAAQLEALRAENCAEAQGWLFGRPAAVPGGFRIPAAACAEPSRDLTAA